MKFKIIFYLKSASFRAGARNDADFEKNDSKFLDNHKCVNSNFEIQMRQKLKMPNSKCQIIINRKRIFPQDVFHLIFFD